MLHSPHAPTLAALHVLRDVTDCGMSAARFEACSDTLSEPKRQQAVWDRYLNGHRVGEHDWDGRPCLYETESIHIT